MSMDIKQIEDLIVKTLDDSKARDIQVMDVKGISSFADLMVVATGTSTTHVKALGSHVEQAFKDAGEPPLGVEAGPQPDWVLVDLGNAIVHVMTEGARAHYALDKLWDIKNQNAAEQATQEQVAD
ncbi:ribosomal silencing factor RsfS [Thiomicrorhabdus immobilis]|uniref:Ribosomal silencing factor RsfS n=1 Tax=Thiomicrorhabdus immobilis TaxID=2791037 RepID=A0ABN6D1K9_9GAMM|nr:ribosome silencing factor [Thiomicrorhabdus immobilis]BCN94017.1 ribosomal silencing factor RsfS [Thiomicrorhabdus immobilis]